MAHNVWVVKLGCKAAMRPRTLTVAAAQHRPADVDTRPSRAPFLGRMPHVQAWLRDGRLLHRKFDTEMRSRSRDQRLARERAWEEAMFTIDELAAIPLFSTLGEKELEYLAGAVEDINLTAGD